VRDDLAPGQPVEHLRVISSGGDELVTDVDEWVAGTAHELRPQGLLRGSWLYEQIHGDVLVFDRGENEVLTGVSGVEEGESGGVGEDVIRGGVDPAQWRERAEPAEGYCHGPARGGTIRAPLGADIEHLRLAARGQRRTGAWLEGALQYGACPDCRQRARRHTHELRLEAGGQLLRRRSRWGRAIAEHLAE